MASRALSTWFHPAPSTSLTLAACLLTCSLPACGDDGGTNIYDEGNDSIDGPDSGIDSIGDNSADGSTGPKLDFGEDESSASAEGSAEGGDGACPPPGQVDATITGTVYAPNFEIPVSGALVWASKTKPNGVPQTVYCAECVELDCVDNPWTLSNADGTFSLALDSGTWWVAVQKGQFLNINEVTIGPGSTALGATQTSLPDRNDPANNRYIPRIAVALGSYDRLEDGLGKLGLGDTIINMNNYSEALIPGTEQFDMWDNGAGLFNDLDVQGSFQQLIQNYALLQQYHIIFVPCSNDAALFGLNAQARDNLRMWVENGGKYYVSDWSNEFLEDTFPQYQDFFLESGSADLYGVYDSVGTVLDPELLSWLEALPPGIKDINPKNGGGGFPTINNLPLIETVDNWSGISATPPVMVDDGMGGQVNVGHKTWVEGPGNYDSVPAGPNPLTISAEYGCGKLMFTTYHMAEGSDTYIGLTPQELVLLYLILEIGVCQVPYEPPPPVE